MNRHRPAALVLLLRSYLKDESYILMVADLLLLGLSLGVIVLLVKKFIGPRQGQGLDHPRPAEAK